LLIRYALLLPVALFSLVAQRDYMEHAALRWQAAEQAATSGTPRDHISAGFEWAGWYLYEEGSKYIHDTGDYTHIDAPYYGVLDPQLLVSDQPVKGYSEEGRWPYHVWLNGGQTRYVLLLKRN
jgi:hypothetical protein